MRGITSDVNIMWSRGNTTVNTTRVTANATEGNLLVYRDCYIIPQLSTSDDGAMYECRLVVYATSPVTATVTLQLDVTGKHCMET